MMIPTSPMSPSMMMIRSPPMSPSSPKMISPISDSQARNQPLIVKEGSVAEKDRARIGELAGGTAAECAAVCCCCPCGLISLLVLAVVRLPAGLCRQAIRRRRRKRKRKKAMAMEAAAGGFGSSDDDESVYHRRVLIDSGGVDSAPSMSPSEEEVELEKEMWAKFYSAGFWRSSSQRE
ncbi:uncharacterized protein LOC120250160 [Dioscorea cayenensis subsp. rotundata]|uniref:Uncharacterized protein LOC120250160 n=1 Tax=Dioscorea cayennensis subsp. rotundata TaxID=55577 RepID=A0AB40AJ03_DIOCR|nr:uncharacterized protein LOC120250160 [Dioscorea cayenensis subsp. rotundata]